MSRIGRNTLIIFTLFLLLFSIGMILLLDADPLEPSTYNTYTRQAMAWREGRTYLEEDVSFLELSIYEGRYYICFPLTPTLIVYPLTFIFGQDVPDMLLCLLYGIATCYLIYALLLKAGWSHVRAAVLGALIPLSSSLLPLMLSGAVWYQAQTLNLMLCMLALLLALYNKPTGALLAYAFSVGCRPFSALMGPILFIILYQKSKAEGLGFVKMLRKWAWGIGLGLMVAAMYSYYNYIRFGDVFEFGYSYLPEFSFQGGQMLAPKHVLHNISEYIFSWPFKKELGSYGIKFFGFSLFLANPILLILIGFVNRDIITHNFNTKKAAIMAFFVFHLFLLLCHRTFGGYQYGARYAVDLIPYALMYMYVDKAPKRLSVPIMLCLLGGLILAIYGTKMTAIW